MPLTLIVKSTYDTVRKEREESAQRVVACVGCQAPGPRLMCFLDDVEWQAFKTENGIANRGFYARVFKSLGRPRREPAEPMDRGDALPDTARIPLCNRSARRFQTKPGSKSYPERQRRPCHRRCILIPNGGPTAWSAERKSPRRRVLNGTAVALPAGCFGRCRHDRRR